MSDQGVAGSEVGSGLGGGVAAGEETGDEASYTEGGYFEEAATFRAGLAGGHEVAPGRHWIRSRKFSGEHLGDKTSQVEREVNCDGRRGQ